MVSMATPIDDERYMYIKPSKLMTFTIHRDRMPGHRTEMRLLEMFWLKERY